VALHIVLRVPDLSKFCFDSYPRMECGTSRNWTAACQLGPRVPIVAACHVSIMQWHEAEGCFGPVRHAAQPSDTGRTRGSALMRGHTRRGCAERPRLRPPLGYDAAAQAATRSRVAAVASAGAQQSAVAVAHGSAHGRPHHRQLGIGK